MLSFIIYFTNVFSYNHVKAIRRIDRYIIIILTLYTEILVHEFVILLRDFHVFEVMKNKIFT